jgi:phenylalanyl-tRNA synthetase beta chain
MRSISNVVDVTNYLLLELGHPLHAFDFNLLRGRRIVVKEAQPGTSFTTLDSQVRLLQAGDLVICDAEGPVALAGIMGGENSEIGPQTVDILLESAYFDPMTIRRTSKRLGIHSESSHRFERGADIDMVPVALDRAAALILEVAGGTLAQGAIDNYPHKIPGRRVTITARRTGEILGVKLDALEIKQLLSGLGLKCQLEVDRADGALTVDIPAYRHDLEREIDLIEEVARLNGYDKIPTTMPASRMLAQPAGSREYVARLRNLMVAAGFAEVINYSFISPTAYHRIGLNDTDPRHTSVAIVNPLTEEQSVMRTTLVPSLLETLARNLCYRSRDLALFELRPVFLPKLDQELPEESLRISAVLCGRRAPEGWNQGADMVDFFDIKGVAETLCQSFHLGELTWDNRANEPFLHPGKSCTLSSGKQVLGTLGEVHPQVLEEYDIDLPVYLLDLGVPQLISAGALHGGFKPLSRFPDVYRDSAFLLDDAVTAQAVLDLIGTVKIKDLEDVVLFDLYRGKGISEGKKSLGVRLRYRSMEKTLTDEEVTKAHGKVVQALIAQLGAEIR